MGLALNMDISPYSVSWALGFDRIFWAYHCPPHEEDACPQASDEETGGKEYLWTPRWLLRGVDASNASSFLP